MWISHDLIRPFSKKLPNGKENGTETSRKRSYQDILDFQATKLREKNNLNWMEFCRRTLPVGVQDEDELLYDPDYTSCARVDAIHFSKHGKSHIQVLKVTNDWGPQTKLMRLNPTGHNPAASVTTTEAPCMCSRPCGWLPSRLEQRLHAVEAQLGLFENSKPPVNLYERLWQIDSRLSYLEGIDPERYVCHGLVLPKGKLAKFTQHIEELKSTNPEQAIDSANLFYIKADHTEVKRRTQAYRDHYQRNNTWRKHVAFFGRPPLDDDEIDEVTKTGYSSCARTTIINHVPVPFVRPGEDGGVLPGAISRDLEHALTLSHPNIQLGEDSPVPPAVYRRIKGIEDRILALEDVSPEIFSHLKLIDKADGLATCDPNKS